MGRGISPIVTSTGNEGRKVNILQWMVPLQYLVCVAESEVHDLDGPSQGRSFQKEILEERVRGEVRVREKVFSACCGTHCDVVWTAPPPR